MNTNDLESIMPIMNKSILTAENTFNIIVKEIIDVISKPQEEETERQNILCCLNNHNITSQYIYNQLLDNQTNSNSVILLGIFNTLGI